MKLDGKKIEGPSISLVVIPRKERDLVFRAEAILDYSDFDKICPSPSPPEILRPGQAPSLDIEDKDYKEKINNWSKNKTSYMILKSLEATENLEWETVDMSDPETWKNFRVEMTDAGLCPAEIGRIIATVIEANALSQTKIDEATARFLAGPERLLEKQ
jgi:hypothetical protein